MKLLVNLNFVIGFNVRLDKHFLKYELVSSHSTTLSLLTDGLKP